METDKHIKSTKIVNIDQHCHCSGIRLPACPKHSGIGLPVCHRQCSVMGCLSVDLDCLSVTDFLELDCLPVTDIVLELECLPVADTVLVWDCLPITVVLELGFLPVPDIVQVLDYLPVKDSMESNYPPFTDVFLVCECLPVTDIFLWNWTACLLRTLFDIGLPACYRHSRIRLPLICCNSPYLGHWYTAGHTVSKSQLYQSPKINNEMFSVLNK